MWTSIVAQDLGSSKSCLRSPLKSSIAQPCPLPFALWPPPFTLTPCMPSSCDPSPSVQVRRMTPTGADPPCAVCQTVIRLTRPDGAHVARWRMHRCQRWWKVPPGLFLIFCFLPQNRMYKMNIISLSKAFFLWSKSLSSALLWNPALLRHESLVGALEHFE